MILERTSHSSRFPLVWSYLHKLPCFASLSRRFSTSTPRYLASTSLWERTMCWTHIFCINFRSGRLLPITINSSAGQKRQTSWWIGKMRTSRIYKILRWLKTQKKAKTNFTRSGSSCTQCCGNTQTCLRREISWWTNSNMLTLLRRTAHSALTGQEFPWWFHMQIILIMKM